MQNLTKKQKNSLDRAISEKRASACPLEKKERRVTDLVTRLITPGNVLLSHRRLLQYPRRWGSSLPCSEWGRVLHPRYGHQAKVFC